MTTNQTIDGVTRELLSDWLKALNSRTSVPVAIRKMRNELRALMDVSLTDEGEKPAAQPQGEPVQEDRETLIGYGRSSGLDEASTLCTRLAYAAYYPPGTRFKSFTPKAQKALGDLLIKAANEIASLPGGPYERFKARQAKKAESAKSR